MATQLEPQIPTRISRLSQAEQVQLTYMVTQESMVTSTQQVTSEQMVTLRLVTKTQIH